MGITLKFDRLGPTSGRISWNIPSPAAGCASETQAYCGIVVTIDSTSNDSTKLPINGTIYSSDATVDVNLFAGDTIGTSKVIGAFYHDTASTFFDVTGLTEHGAYYVSGFPVDCENRYYKEGVHAYSLDYKHESTTSTSGTQVVILNQQSKVNGGALPTDVTGLLPSTIYQFAMQRGLVPKPARPVDSQELVPAPFTSTITIDGTYAATYGDLLNAINVKLQLLDNPPQGPTPPNTGAYYFNSVDNTISLWDGSQHITQPIIKQATPPNTLTIGVYWLNTTSGALKQWDGTLWNPIAVIAFTSPPSIPVCETTYWFDGTNGYTWTGNAWLKHTIYSQTVNPSLFKPAQCGTFWYNTTTFELSSWDDTLQIWISANAVQYSVAPNALPSGTYWFNATVNKLFQYNIPNVGWNDQPTARITEIEPVLTVVAGTLWYNPSTMVLKVRDSLNAAWIDTDLVVFATDPTQVTYCSNWWNTVNNTMNVWDGVNGVWNVASQFLEQAADPTLPPLFNEEDLWYNPTTSTLYYWQNNCFKVTPYLYWPTDPVNTIPNGTAWHDTVNGLWYIKTGTLWVPTDVIAAISDPSALPAGTLWFNAALNSLQLWNGAAWVSLTYSSQPLTPVTGAVWFNSTTNKLMTWDGYAWVYAVPTVTLVFNHLNNFSFKDTSTGSLSWVSVGDISLFRSLTTGFFIDNPIPGTDGVSDQPSYQEIGVGTDGTNDERLTLMNEIRYSLGYPNVDVELYPEQLNLVIDIALQTLREHSSICYNRGFFFLSIQANLQKYLLTNKVSGMNKIVSVMGIYRLTSSFLSSAMGAGVYGQIVIQHLYNMGTFDLLSYHIMSEYTKNMEILFAARITFNWNEQTRELNIHHRFAMNEHMCLVEAMTERTEQHILQDRICRPWLRKWAIAESMMMLANSRGKFSTLPGAGGSVSLNASDLRQQAATDKELCMQEIFDFVVDRPEEIGLNSTLIFG
jgi:hypothetical protein